MWNGKLRKAGAAVFAVAALTGAALVLYRGRDALAGVLAQPKSLPYLLAGVAASAAAVALGYRAWASTLAGLGEPVPTRAGLGLFCYGFLGKFIPGRVWGVLAQAELGRAAGVSRGRMAATYVVNLAVVLVTGGLVALLAAPKVLGANAFWLAIPALLAVLAITRPQLITRLIRRNVKADRLRRAVLAQIMAWPLQGLHLWLLVMLLGAAPLASLPLALGGFALATIAGTAALLAPDGIGVRELVIVAALASILPLPEAGVVALVSRLVATVGELAAAAPMLLFSWSKKGLVPAHG